MSFMPKDGEHPARVGDEDEVAPNCWDCFRCSFSVDKTGAVGERISCSNCGAEYEITSEVAVVPRQYVRLTKRGEEYGLYFYVPDYFYPGKGIVF